MSEPWHVEIVDTPAGPYTIELYPDWEPSLHPIGDDNEVFAALIEYSGYGGRWDLSTDTLNSAGRAGDVLRELLDNFSHDPDAIGRRYLKWVALSGSSWILAMGGQSASQSDYYRYALLANSDELTDATQSIKNVMADYQTYASGGVMGFVARDPGGNVVESVWGFYSDEDALDEGRAVVQHDAAERAKNASLAGAGFVGIV